MSSGIAAMGQELGPDIMDRVKALYDAEQNSLATQQPASFTDLPYGPHERHRLDLYDPQGSNAKQLRTVVDKSERQLVKLEKQRATLDDSIAELKNAMSKWRAALADRQASAG